MKHIKLFEAYRNKERFNSVINPILAKSPGDIVPEDQIYVYVEALHHTDSDFEDGDLGERIEHYPKYILGVININTLDLDEWYWDENEVDNFEERFKTTGKYPPIVVSHDYSIIDGTHRANALKQAGEENILAFVGVGNTDVYDSFE